MATIIEKETLLSGIVNALLVVLLLTGGASYLFLSHGTLLQTLTLSHVAVGICLDALLIPYIWTHYRRTIGYRRPVTLFLGILAIASLLLVCITGSYLALNGHQERLDWLPTLHIISVVVFIVSIACHLIHHRLTFPEKRLTRTSLRYESLTTLKKSFVTLMICLSILVGVLMLLESASPSYGDKPVQASYTLPYGDHVFRPSQTETTHNAFVDAALINDSEQCKHCHADISRQWLASSHRQAASDKSYETNINLLVSKKGIEAARYCEGCHAPVALLSGSLTPGGYHGGMAETDANREGVNCLGCHGIKQTLNTKGVASYEFGMHTPYLFNQSNNVLLRELNHLSIRLNPTQHKRDMMTKEMSQSAYCSSCHAQFMDESMNNWGWVQMQDEYTAWLNSNFSGHHEPDFAQEDIKQCQHCHMPQTPSDDPSATVEGTISNHRFVAANTMLPLLANDSVQLEKTIEFLQSNKMTISIDKPYRNDATRNSLALDERIRSEAIQPYYYYKGEKAKIQVIVANRGVGHNFPAGTIDINEAWIAIEVRDAAGKEVFSSGAIKEGEALDKGAYIYRSIPVNRQGNHVWKHDLFNMIGAVSKNFIPAGESDVVDFTFHVPFWAKSPLTINTSLKYRKLNLAYAKWALKDEYQDIPIVDMARDFLTIPIKDEQEVYSSALQTNATVE